MIEIIAIGRKLDPLVVPLVKEYEARLRSPYDIKWTLLPYSKLQGMDARRDESRKILEKLTPDKYVILLDEVGQNISSEQLAERLDRVQATGGRKVVFVVGGAYGVDETIQRRADFVWSLSKLVFPHRIVHLVLTEQIYRAQEILRGGSYHHK